MNKLIAFLRLIRAGNLFMIGLTQYLIKIFILDIRYIDETVLSNTLFFFLVLSTIMIAAGGYIINDIYDINTDLINKKERVIIGRYISEHTAFFWYYALNLISIILGGIICYKIGKISFFIIFIYCIAGLWIYAKNMKKMFIVDNLHISFLTALSIINIALFDLLGVLGKNKITHSHITDYALFTIIMYYALFAFLISLVREIIKDIEDIEGDRVINAKTAIIFLGLRNVKIILILICTLIMSLIAYFQYIQYSFSLSTFEDKSGEIIKFIPPGTDKFSIIYVGIIQIMILLLIFNIFKAKRKKEFSKLSFLTKVIMFLGILSIPLFFISNRL